MLNRNYNVIKKLTKIWKSLKKLSLNYEAIETSTDTNSEKVETRLNKEEIEKRVKHLRVQLDVVGRKCSDIILQNSQAYSVELKRVSDFKGLLEDSYQICAIARRALAMSEFMFVVPSLKLVKKQLKKSHLVQLYTAVTEIKSFVINNTIFNLPYITSFLGDGFRKVKNQQFFCFDIYFKEIFT